VLRLDPQLPRELERIDMRVRYRGHALDLRITSDTLTIRGRERGPAPVNLAFRDDVFAFDGLETRVFDLATANESRSRRAGTG
jgi:hypothetical protein